MRLNSEEGMGDIQGEEMVKGSEKDMQRKTRVVQTAQMDEEVTEG